jgi:thiol-disulfide isomerase/thioredoxin
MKRRGYLVAAMALVVLAVGAVIFASTTNPSQIGSGSENGDGSAAPVLQADGWLNSAPLTQTQLQGKVVLYDFWTYSCVNCVRTLPYLRSLYDRYKDDGLVVVGIHSPEFDFEKNHTNVQQAVTKLGVDWPVAFDDNMRIWNAFGNQYWPADYIYDRQDRQVSVHFGEGGYQDTENLVRKLLAVPANSPRATVSAADSSSTDNTPDMTPETYNGAERGAANYASPQPLVDGPNTFTAPGQLDTDQHALIGPWLISDEYVQSNGPGAAIQLRYYAGEVNLVLGTADGQPADVQVQVDSNPPTTVHVTTDDLYNLVKSPIVGTHTVTVTPSRPGVQAYAFTFGD